MYKVIYIYIYTGVDQCHLLAQLNALAQFVWASLTQGQIPPFRLQKEIGTMSLVQTKSLGNASASKSIAVPNLLI